MMPDQFEIVRVEFVEFGCERIRSRRTGEAESANVLQAGKVFEEGPDDAGDRDIPHGAPDADIPIGLVVDGYGDVAHIGS